MKIFSYWLGEGQVRYIAQYLVMANLIWPITVSSMGRLGLLFGCNFNKFYKDLLSIHERTDVEHRGAQIRPAHGNFNSELFSLLVDSPGCQCSTAV